MVELTKSEEDYLMEERLDEWRNETTYTIKDEWISDNWIALLKDFADQESEAFKLFCNEAYAEYEENK